MRFQSTPRSAFAATTFGAAPNATAPTSFTINITWDSSVQSAPAAFKADVIAAVNYYESMLTNPVTINLDVGYGEIDGTAVSGGDLGESQGELMTVSYAQLVSALRAGDNSATDASMLASLPKTSPANGGYVVTTAQAKALGLLPAAGTALDGYVGFDTSAAFSYSDAGGVTAGKYDFMSVVLHEISEVMGRYLLVGNQLGTATHYYSLLDLLHYSAPGVHDLVQSTPGYFSINGGVTNLGNFNTIAGGDAGDWARSVVDDSYQAFSNSGTVDVISANDLALLNAIGWNLNGPGLNAAPTGVALMMVTGSVAKIQSAAGLVASTAISTFKQTGDYGWDSYKFTLGGAGAGVFALSNSDNQASLSTGSGVVAGAANGTLYALRFIATDTTTGKSSAALPLDIIVGNSSAGTITLATLMGSGSTAPAFVFGLASHDVINGAGITGEIWIDAGGSGDTLTGGNGVNNYLFSSTVAADLITNFHVASDIINLTGLGIDLSYAGKLTGGAIAAGTVGWLISSANTYVDINTSGASEALAATSMTIELAGSMTLTASNFAYA